MGQNNRDKLRQSLQTLHEDMPAIPANPQVKMLNAASTTVKSHTL